MNSWFILFSLHVVISHNLGWPVLYIFFIGFYIIYSISAGLLIWNFPLVYINISILLIFAVFPHTIYQSLSFPFFELSRFLQRLSLLWFFELAFHIVIYLFVFLIFFLVFILSLFVSLFFFHFNLFLYFLVFILLSFIICI